MCGQHSGSGCVDTMCGQHRGLGSQSCGWALSLIRVMSIFR